MKYVVIAQAEKRVYLEAQVVVEIPDGVAIDEGKIQELCHEPVMKYVANEDVRWEEYDSELPEFTGVDDVEVAHAPDDEADIRFVLDKDGSLVFEGEVVNESN